MKEIIKIILIFTLFNAFGQKMDTILYDNVKVFDSFEKNDSIISSKIETRKDTFSYFVVIDTNLIEYRLPNEFTKPINWINAEKSRKKIEFYGNIYSDTVIIDEVLHIIDSEKDFRILLLAKSWCIKNYEEIFPFLINRLTVKQKIGLTNTADLIIWDRIGIGDMKFYGHGGEIQEDIFTISGRVSWLLNEITGENFTTVHGNLTKEQAILYKNKWIEYVSDLKVK